MPRDGYLLYDPSLEQIQPGERETIQAIVDSIGRTNKSSFTTWHRGIRQQHAKAHGFLRGTLTIYDDLPEHLRTGGPAGAAVGSMLAAVAGEIIAQQSMLIWLKLKSIGLWCVGRRANSR